MRKMSIALTFPFFIGVFFFVWGMIVGSLVFLCWAPHYYRGGETLVSKVSLSLCSICFVREANFLGLEEGKSLGGNVGIV